jgi:cytochrome c
MHPLTRTLLLGAVVALAAQAAAADGKMLAIKYGCIACHKVEGKMVGPSYREVASRYKEQQGASDQLLSSVMEGAVNNWGAVPMPAKGGRANLSEQDAAQLVDWILTL